MSAADEWTPDMGATTTRMWAGLQHLERSKVRLDEELTEVERELRSRIEKSVDVSQAQAEAIDALIHRVERLDDVIKALSCAIKRHQQALFGTDEGKEGLVVEQRILRRAVQFVRAILVAVAGAVAFAFQQGWIRGPA